MDLYVSFVREHVMLSAFLQFAILGTVGELIGARIATGTCPRGMGARVLCLKAVSWGILGILIKYAFTGFYAFPAALAESHLLPGMVRTGFFRAFSVSLFMNILFGPQMMFFHRFTDNLITGTRGYAGMRGSLMTLLWFWIPAHTVTFLLPVEFRVGLAALWSVSLGCILGFFKRKAG